MRPDIDVDLVDQFAYFLQGGKPPSGITLMKRPRKMTAAQAMAVIYVLQEFVHCIPDVFEMCVECARVYDTEREGHTTEDGKFYCDNCSFKCSCSICMPADDDE